ncbi:MAG TPA: hypothetical protein VJN42_10825 [Candidatus Acidoferrum sp.]|nr:hypothetical protein [Candidatus Acidoferrum sp.]
MELAWPVLVVCIVLSGALLFTPYEAIFEGVVALLMVTAVAVGFLMHPRRETFYVRTAVRGVDSDRNQFLEHDSLAVRVELVRLWLLFVPTVLAVASLVAFAAAGPMKFSFLNWLFSSRYALIATFMLQYAPLFVLLLTAAWIEERRVMRDAEACSASTFSIFRPQVGPAGRIAYAFRGEHGEYYGGYCFCLYLRVDQSPELATIVFHNVRNPDLNKIAMGFLFHRLTILGRGVTDLDKQTSEVQTLLAETTS